jgi:hypothetical protein
MLAHILAVLVGTGSLGLYIAAFFFPEIHRKQDFIWSGVGFFYALSLWIYARQIAGGVLVGETASVALLGWFVWQTLKLRRQLVPTNQQTPIPSTSKIQQQLGLKPKATSQPISPTKSKPTTEPVTSKPNPTPAEPTPGTGTVDRSQPKSSPVVPPTPSVPSVRVPVEVRVERKQPQPPTAVPTVPTPAEPPVVRATIPAPVAVPVEPKPQKPPTVSTPVPTIPTAVVPAPVAVPVEPKQPQAPKTVPAVPPPADEAWIKLEVKPSSPNPSKPIGQAAKPPTTPPTQPAAITSESVPRNAPTDTESIPKLDPDSSNN